MVAKPFYLLVHTDHHMDPAGPNSGAEMATINQAKYLARAGERVIVAAHLKGEGALDRRIEGVDYWNVGPGYDVETALNRADATGDYFIISAGRALPLFFARHRPRCLHRILITHDRGAGDAGCRPSVLTYVADQILCVSHAQREKLIAEGNPGDKMIVIHNGVDLDLFPMSPPEDHNPRRLIFSGALIYDKGIHLLLNSFLQLKQKYPDLELEVFGSADLWSRSEYLDFETIKRGNPDIHFHGKVQQAEIAKGYARSGIAVIPSPWFDPFPLTSLEAQVCGCPVVAFDVGGLREGILDGTTGVVIKEISQEALTTTLDRVLADPAHLRRMSAAASRHARETFRWEKVVAKIADLCNSGGRSATRASEGGKARAQPARLDSHVEAAAGILFEEKSRMAANRLLEATFSARVAAAVEALRVIERR